MFQLGPHKALGKDGLSTSFFQKHWAWVGEDEINFTKKVFHKGEVPEDMNQTLISLILKHATLRT